MAAPTQAAAGRWKGCLEGRPRGCQGPWAEALAELKERETHSQPHRGLALSSSSGLSGAVHQVPQPLAALGAGPRDHWVKVVPCGPEPALGVLPTQRPATAQGGQPGRARRRSRAESGGDAGVGRFTVRCTNIF